MPGSVPPGELAARVAPVLPEPAVESPAPEGAPDDALPRTRDGRRVRSADAPVVVSPLRALAGAGMAVAGVVLGIGALLSVTGTPEGSPVLSAAPARLESGPGEPAATLPEDDAPAVLPSAATEPVPPAPVTSPPPAQAPPQAAAERQAAAAPRQATGTAAPRRAAAARPAVTVLNNSTRTGLADRAAARFARNGWPVRQVGNFRGQLRATTVYYEPGQRAAAQRFAGTFRGIARVLPRPANIPGPRGLVVVLTRSFDA